MPNKILKQPKVIDDLALLRQRFSGDKYDLAEIQEKENLIKDSLLRLSIEGNEGIKLLKKDALDQLETVYYRMIQRPKKMDEEWIKEQMYLHSLEEVWLWFMAFFEDAHTMKKIVEEYVKRQLEAQRAPVEDEEY